MKGIRITRYGGPEVLEYGELPDPAPRAHADLEARRTTGKILLTA